MTAGTARHYSAETYDDPGLSFDARPQRMLGGAALTCIAFACSWTLCSNLIGPPAGSIDISGTRGDRLMAAAPRAANPATAPSKPNLPSQPTPQRLAKAKAALAEFALLFDPHYATGSPPGMFAQSTPYQPRGWQVAAAPPAAQAAPAVASASPPASKSAQSVALAPPPRAPATRMAAIRDDIHRGAAKAMADTRTIFEKLFGKSSPSLSLAYADADAGGLGARGGTSGLYDRSTAVYDISAHKVYLPDGTELEAHSGYGSLLDDPSHADVHDRGVTPPTLYQLEPRESLFHGVRALRLIPVDDNKVFGRSGLLAHSYMLGPNGDSNGCVSFKDYDAFLEAFENQKISRLAVVSHLE
jgi:hypothetical protein